MLTRDRVQVEDYQGDTPLQCAVNLSRHEVSRHDRAHVFGPRRLLSLLGALIWQTGQVVRWIKWHKWCDQGKFRESSIEPPQPFEGFGGNTVDPHVSQTVSVNSHDQSPMTSPRKNGRGRDYSVPHQAAFARPPRR